MNKVIACIDGAEQTASVCDYAAWSALRLDAPLEFLHVLERHPEKAPARDLSGSIGLGAQEDLLEQLSALDEQRSRLAYEHGRQLLQAARQRAAQAGVTRLDARQRHGTLEESLLEMQADTRLIVLGHHYRRESFEKIHLDHHIERVIRAVQRPVLVASTDFRTPERFAIAFDGSPTGRKMVETVARSPMLRGLQCHLVMAGTDTPQTHDQSAWARTALMSADFEVTIAVINGEAESVLHGYVREHALDLLVMGAYGHSRIRQLVVGSTTTTMLRTSPVPVLILR